MQRTLLQLAIFLAAAPLFSQPNYTALDSVRPFSGQFRVGINMGYNPNWTNEQQANIAAGNPELGQPGIGATTTRPGMYEEIYASFGYNLTLYDFQVFQNRGMTDLTGIIGGPPQWNLDFTNYCAGQPSAIFKDIYLPIWDAGNGTPYNEANPFAAYVYKLVDTYKNYVTFWEIWNEPGFDYSGGNGRKLPGQPGNWWDNDPPPCEYALRAPIERYVRMLRISYEIIKTLDPDGYVTLGDPGFPSFLDAVLRNTDNPTGGSVTANFPKFGGAYFDAVSFHAYPHFDFTCYDPANGIFERHSDGASDGLIISKNRFQNVLENRGFDGTTYPEKVWMCTEFNAPRRAITSNNWLNGAELQRNYLLKVLMEAKKSGIAQMHVYSLFDVRPDFEAVDEFDLMGMYSNNTGVTAYNQTVNPQGKAQKTFTDLLGNTTFDAAKTAAMNLPTGVRGVAFKKPNGQFIYSLWAETQTDQTETASKNYTFPAALQMTDFQRFDWDFGYSGTSAHLTNPTISLTAAPQFFEKNLAPGCVVSASVTNILCNDNGTASDPSDDKFSFNLTVNGTQTASTLWKTDIAGQNFSGNFGQSKNLAGFNISAGNLNFTVADTAVAACAATVNVTAPATCSNQQATQYCNSKGDFPWHEWIANVKIGTINKTSDKAGYSDFTANSATLAAGQTHPLELTIGFSWFTFNDFYRIWVDFNKNKTFEAGEIVSEGSYVPAGNGLSSALVLGNLNIPANAATGTTRMRISIKRGAFPQPCELIPFGEVEDFTVNISPAGGACSINASISNILCQNNGTPTIGGDDTYTFSAMVTGANTGQGWSVNFGNTVISGNYGVAKTFGPHPILGGTQTLLFRDLADANCTTTQLVTAPGPCSNGGGTGTYCPSSGDFPWHDWIAQFQFSDLNHTSSKSQYSDFLNKIATVETGQIYNLQLTTGFSWLSTDEFWRVWIDYDKDGDFESNELIFSQLNPASPFPVGLWSVVGQVSIPTNVAVGVTRMRVVMHRGGTAPEPCGTNDFGETEDYSVNIIDSGGQTCQVFGQVSNLSCQNNGTPNLPGDDTFSFSLTVTGAGTGSGWSAAVGNTTFSGSYGVPKSMAGFSIAAGALNFSIKDNADATCQQPIVVAPPAPCSSQTGPCASSSAFPWHDWIENIKFSNLNNPSGKSQYSDFTAQTVNVVAGAKYPLQLITGYSWFGYDENLRIWMDFNKNGSFDAGEKVFEKAFIAPGNNVTSVTYSDSIQIPANAATGLTKMRVSMKRDAFSDPCETLPFGEVEDYSVNVAQGLQAGDARSFSKFSATENLTVYPNPASDVLRIFAPDYLGEEIKILIFNQLGMEVKRVVFEKVAEPILEIDINNLTNGRYFLMIKSEGKRVAVRKFLVENGF